MSYSSTSSGPAPAPGRSRPAIAPAPPRRRRRARPSGRVPLPHERIGDVVRGRRPDGPSAARRRARSSTGEPGARAPRRALVLVLEARSQRRQRLPVGTPIGDLDLDLPALAAVAQVGGARHSGSSRPWNAAATSSISPKSESIVCGSTASTSRWHDRTSWNSGRANSRPTALNSPATAGTTTVVAPRSSRGGPRARGRAAVGDDREVARVAALLRTRPIAAHGSCARSRSGGSRPRPRARSARAASRRARRPRLRELPPRWRSRRLRPRPRG